jgi:hypothetical protein
MMEEWTNTIESETTTTKTQLITTIVHTSND